MELYLRKGVPLVVPPRAVAKNKAAEAAAAPSALCSSPSDLLAALRTLDAPLTRESLSLLAFQLMLLAKPTELSDYYSALLYAWSPEFREVLSPSHNATKSLICGRVFKKDEIIWECKQCGMDGTCVQCDACFKKSDHTGHDVMFHKSGGGGGCCDCGDPEAWSAEGSCPDHRRPCESDTDGCATEDPLTSLSTNCQTGFAALLDGASVALTSIVCQSVRGFEPWTSNPFTSGTVSMLALRLFNDDVHTYDDVTRALSECRLSDAQARALTKLVDKAGSALVRRGTVETVSPAWRSATQTFGLVASVVPDWLLNAEGSAASALQWFKDVGMLNPGLKRLVSTSLASCLRNGSLCAHINELAAEMAFGNPVFRVHLTYQEMFPEVSQNPDGSTASGLMFPSKLPFLDSRRPTYDRSPRTPIPTNLQRNPMLLNMEIRCPIAIFLAASTFMSKQFQGALEEIVLNFQHDVVFRHSYTQLLTLFYPYLNGLYCAGIGTTADTLLTTTAQLFTSQAMVQLMSSKGINDRFYNEVVVGSDGKTVSEAVMIAKVIINATIDSLKLCELGRTVNPLGTEAIYAKNSCARNHKYHRTFLDIDYALRSHEFALSVLSGATDPGAIEAWAKLCLEMTGVEYHRRMKGSSLVSQDNDHWSVILEAAMTMERTSSSFLQAAFTCPVAARNSTADFDALHHQALIHTSKVALDELTYYWKSYQDSVAINTDFKAFYRLIDVSDADVTIYTTLQRFFVKTILTACRGGVKFSLCDVISLVSDAGLETIMSNTIWAQLQGTPLSTDKVGRKFASFLIADEALRVLSFAAQVRAKLWIRNGDMPANIILNYEGLSCCSDFRDNDIFALQLSSMLWSDVPAFINTCLYTFEISELPVSNMNRINRVPLAAEYRTFAMAALLRTFILMTTLVPMDFFDESIPSALNAKSMSGYNGAFDMLLKRELLHVVAAKYSNQDVARVKLTFGCSSRSISDTHVDAILKTVTDPEKTDTKHLLPVLALDFDVEHAHSSPSSHQKATENIRELRSMLKRDARKYKLDPSAPFPVVSSAAILPLHSAFKTLRSFLFHPRLIVFLHEALDQAIPKTNAEKIPNSLLVICRVVHLVTLMIHSYEDAKRAAASCANTSIESRLESPDFLSGVLTFDEKLQDSSSSVVSLINRLCQVYSTGLISSDSLYHEGLLYLLLEFGRLSIYIQEAVLPVHGIVAMSASTTVTGSTSKLERRRLAETKAMLNVIDNAWKFCQENGVAIPKALSDSHAKLHGGESVPGAGAPMEVEGGSKADDLTEEDTSSEIICTVCRAGASPEQPCGLLCHIQSSRMIANILSANEFLGLYDTDASGSEHRPLSFSSAYRVIFREGADIYSNATESKRVGHLAYGDYVTIAKRDTESQWVQVLFPIAGWTRLQLMHGNKYVSEATGVEQTTKYVISVLQSVKEVMFNQFGGTRAHVSVCGHAMHYSCYDNFYIASLQNQSSADRESRQCTFKCPMCNTVGNAFLPILSNDHTKNGVLCEESAESELWHKVDSSESPSFDKEVAIRSRTLASTLADTVSPYDLFRRSSPYEVKIPELVKYTPFEIAEKVWSAGAYTLLSATLNSLHDASHASEGVLPAIKRIHERDGDAVAELLQLSRYLQFVLWNEVGGVNYSDSVLGRLENLLFGDRTFACEAECGEPVVSESSEEAIYHTLDHLPHQFVSENQSFYETQRVRKRLSGLLNEEESWRYLNLPLLSHDLHVVAFAALGNVRSTFGLNRIIKTLIQARLLQIFVEPSCNIEVLYRHTQRKYGKEAHNIVPAAATPLLELTMEYRGLAGISSPAQPFDANFGTWRAILETELKSIISDSLLPFVHYLNSLATIALTSIPNPEISIDTALATYLSRWGLSSDINILAKTTREEPIATTWASQYKRFYASTNKSSEVSLDYWVPQQLAVVRASNKRKATTLGSDSVNNSLEGEEDERSHENHIESNQSEISAISTSPQPISDVRTADMDTSEVMQTDFAVADLSGGEHAVEEEEGDAGDDEEDIEGEEELSEEFEDDEDEEDEEGIILNDGDEEGFEMDDDDEVDFATMDLINEVFDFGVMADLVGNQQRQARTRGGDGDAQAPEPEGPPIDEFVPVSMNGSRLESKLTSWSLVGIDPASVVYDDFAVSKAYSEQRAITPNVGNVSGTNVVFTSQLVPSKHGIVDVSHFGLGMRHRRSFIKLPHLYTDLFQQIKLPVDEMNASKVTTGLCLVCGQVVKAGKEVFNAQTARMVGECALHSYKCGGGTSVFLLLEDCRVLLTSEGRQIYHPSIYLNRNGETEDMRYSTRPHFLSESRLRKLEDMYFKHKVAAEVFQKRSTATHIIRMNWY